MGFQGSAPPPDVNVTVEPAGATIENNVNATLPADLTTTNLYGARVFGNGSDGDVLIPAGVTVTLTRDMQYNNLTIEAGGVLCAAGWLVQVAGTLLVYGKLHNEGQPGADALGVKSFTVLGGAGGLTGRFHGGAKGADGRDKSNGATGTTGITGPAPTDYSTAGFVTGGTAGIGGGIASGVQGGAVVAMPSFHPLLVTDTQNMKEQKYTGAGGGGGGAASGFGGDCTSASGGGGGGFLPVFAKSITNAGTISAKGGDGGDYFSDFTGAGGGGGGGVIVLVYSTYTGNAPDFSGGLAGVQSTPYAQPSAGRFGKLIEIVAKQ